MHITLNKIPVGYAFSVLESLPRVAL